MQIVIDISESIYDCAKELGSLSVRQVIEVENAIKNGIPLPKRMLSVDLIIDTLCQKDEDYDYPCIAPSYLEEELERLLLDDAPTADKESKDADSD